MIHLLAQQNYTLTGPGVQVTADSAAENLERILSTVIGVLTVVAVIYFIFQIIFAGYAFLTTEGDKNKMETARKRLTEGIMGLTIVIIAVTVGALIARIAGLGDVLYLNNVLGDLFVN